MSYCDALKLRKSGATVAQPAEVALLLIPTIARAALQVAMSDSLKQ